MKKVKKNKKVAISKEKEESREVSNMYAKDVTLIPGEEIDFYSEESKKSLKEMFDKLD